MVHSGTTITHQGRPSLSNLQVSSHSSPPSSVPVTVTSSLNTNRTSSTRTEELRETATMVTAISFATPENSPFLSNKKINVVNGSGRGNNNNNSNNSSNNNNTISNTISHTSNNNNNSSNNISNTNPASISANTATGGIPAPSTNSHVHPAGGATSVTPMEKVVKFESNLPQINKSASSESSSSLPHSLTSEGDRHIHPLNPQVVVASRTTAVTVTAKENGQSHQLIGRPLVSMSQPQSQSHTNHIKRDDGDDQQPQEDQTHHRSLIPGGITTTSTSTTDRTNDQSNSQPSWFRSGSHTESIGCPPGRIVSNSPDQDTKHLPKNGQQQQHPQQQHQQQASFPVPSDCRPSSSSPSRVPLLQPRKLSESIHVSSACSDAGSVPPSLCSSASTPESDTKEEVKQQQQLLRRTVSESFVHVKRDEDANNMNIGSKQQILPHHPCAESSTRNNNMNINISTNSNSNSNTNVNQMSSIKQGSNANSSATNSHVFKHRQASPVPPTTTRAPEARTPVRSPVSSKYGSRFSVDFAQLGSPGIFLSPYLPSPPDSRKNGGNGQKGTTPTNFAKDFGKTDLSSSSFDATNVLPWLSPTSYSLFSPGGGMASINNTPGGMFSSIPRTPRTPNGSKLNIPLPLTNDTVDIDPKKKTNGISSMICVSPLASRKSNITATTVVKGGKTQSKTNPNASAAAGFAQPQTPIDFREVFASPKMDSRGLIRAEQSNEIPTLGHVNEAASNEEMCSRLSLEKHTAERDVREDEDLNVLMGLAETTPNRRASELKAPVRAARNQFAYPNQMPAPTIYPLPKSAGEHPASLHLPFIGKNGNATKARKKHPGALSDDFTPPPLPIRSNKSASALKTSKKKTGKTKDSIKKEKSPFQQTTGHPKPMYPPQYPTVHLHHPPPGVYPHPPPHFMHPHGAYYPYPPPPGSGHPPPPPPPYPIYSSGPIPTGVKPDIKKIQKVKTVLPKVAGIKRQLGSPNTEAKKRAKTKTSRKGGKRSRTTVTQPLSGPEREKSAANIKAINAATGNKNDKAASLASAILRGVTMRPSGKWQAQLYYAGKSRYIGVFDTREKAALAYEIAREKLKTDKPASEQSAQSLKETEANVNAARKAAFEGVNEKDPRNGK